MDVMVVGPPAPRSRLSFGGESQSIASVVFASSHISCIRSTDLQTEQNPSRRGVYAESVATSSGFVSAQGNIDEGRMLRLDHFLGISRYIGLSNALLGVEWYVDTEFLKEQL